MTIGAYPEPLQDPFYLAVQRGDVPGHSIVTKFGYASVSTTLVPITEDLIYNTPTSPVSLEFVSSSANDATGGTGATKITYVGLDSNWDEVTGVIDTNGLTAVPLPDQLVRLYRWYVSESGTYAGISAPSYVGNLTLRVSGGGASWSTISASGVYPGQSEIGVYSLPRNKRCYLISKHIFTDTGKTANVYLLARQNADDVTTPYAGVRRLQEREIGVSGNVQIAFEALKGPYTGPCDIGFIGNVASGNADISVEFDLLIIDDGF